MKFAQIALAFFAATAVLADTVSLSGDCKKAYDDYEECGKTEGVNADDFLKTYQSEKCQNLYKDPIATLGKCGDLDATTKDKLIADVKFSQAFNTLFTSKTEDGKNCPLYRNNDIEKVKDTCASKSCTSASIEAYKLYVEGKKLNKNDEATVAVYENILKELQACGGANAATVAGNSTDANAANNNAANANGAANNGTQVAVNGTNANANANTESSDASALKYTMALVFAAIYLLF